MVKRTHRKHSVVKDKSQPKPPPQSSTASGGGDNGNRPRNIVITDATVPYTFSFRLYGGVKNITVQQTNAEETWPGGALWDIGVLMAKALVLLRCGKNSSQVAPSRWLDPRVWSHNGDDGAGSPGTPSWWQKRRVLELGCGVGLTGLVAAALGSKLVVLTDLEVVIRHVTAPNVERNRQALGASHKFTDSKQGSSSVYCAGCGNVVTTPLCWGNSHDSQTVAQLMDDKAAPHVPRTSTSRSKVRKQQQQKHPGTATTKTSTGGREKQLQGTCDNGTSLCDSEMGTEQAYQTPQDGSLDDLSTRVARTPSLKKACAANATTAPPPRAGIPDVLLIGDVAYQHKPGAPSHFDELLSTALAFSDEHTKVIFGTRMRMPASADLLHLFQRHYDECLVPPLAAHELDPAFEGQPHHMTLHVFTKKKMLPTNASTS